MKIGLILPKCTTVTNKRFTELWKNSPEAAPDRFFFNGFGIGLLIVAALTPEDIEIVVIDEEFEELDFNKKYDLIGISSTTQFANRAYEIADEYRKRGTKVVMGGIHPSLMPEEAKKHSDTVIVGESEKLWPEFIEDFLKESTKPFYYSSQQVNLLKSPKPRYDLLKLDRYGIIWVQATRGCPHDCEFCAASKIFGYRYRHKSIRQIVDEIEFIKSLKKSPYIGFADDNMFVNLKYSTELIKELRDLKIRWVAQSDISIAEKGEIFLKSLKKSGCIALYVGFETLSEKGLKNIDRHNWKMKYFKKYSEHINKIQSNGIGVMGAFIVGLDADNKGSFDKISDFIIQNNLFGAGITILTPLPGTRLRARLEKEKRILSDNWDNYHFWKANYEPMNMTVEELENGLAKIYQTIYSKEAHLKKIKYFKEIYTSLLKKDNKYDV